MAVFSKQSKEKLETCCQEIQDICNEAIKEINFIVICGYRGKEDQDKAFNEGFSKLKYPQSRHNQNPSMAIDAAPFPIRWSDTKSFKRLADVMLRIAEEKGIDLTWGGGWQNYKDLPHYEVRS